MAGPDRPAQLPFYLEKGQKLAFIIIPSLLVPWYSISLTTSTFMITFITTTAFFNNYCWIWKKNSLHKLWWDNLWFQRKCNDPQSRTWFTSQTILGCLQVYITLLQHWRCESVYCILFYFETIESWGWLIWMSCWFLNESSRSHH